jgi:hypothetical protein
VSRRALSAAAVGAALLLAALVAGCGPSGPLTYVWVDIEARPAVRGVTAVEITVRQGGESLTKTFGDGAAPFALPTSLTITPNSHLGDLTIEGVATDAAGARVAQGRTAVTVAAATQPRVTLRLEPDDFQVNTTVAGAQIVTDYGGRAGRQLATSATGDAVVVYENISDLGRFDGLGRLFTGDGAPRQNEVSRTHDDFILNQDGSESVFYVAVGAAASGAFLATWVDYSGVGTVNARAFDPSGTPAAEVILSAVDAVDPGAGHAAAFADGSWVVVWSQARSASDATAEVRARLLGPDGTPRQNGTTGNTLDFPVGAFTAHDTILPAVSVGYDDSFLVVWADVDASGGSLHAQRFSKTGVASSAEVVVAQLRLAPDGANVAATPDGYLVVYSDQGASAAERDVYVRYLGADGIAPQAGYRVNTTSDGSQLEPAVAVAPDGRAFVVWTDLEARAEDGDSGSIRGRALHPFGLPIGADQAINTTTTKAQFFPAVAAAADGAFFVAWQDESGAGPDVDESGVRGRLVYPDYGPADGALGARCGGDAPACQSELTCTPAGGGSYCHAACTPAEVGSPCPYGGTCTAALVTGTPTPVCFFR